jgi:hypothetical protein
MKAGQLLMKNRSIVLLKNKNMSAEKDKIMRNSYRWLLVMNAIYIVIFFILMQIYK